MPKIVDHDQYRKELLGKCFDLFAEKGYGSITMRQIAQGLGVSTGTLYHYFPSKEALFLQMVEEQTQQDILNFQTESSGAQTLPERIDALMNFLAKYEDYFFNQMAVSLDFYQQVGRAEVLNNEILRRSSEQTRQVIGEYLQISDKAIVDFVFTYIGGLIIGRLYEGDTISFDEQSMLLKKILMAYLGQQLSSNS
ncbi:MAG: TetR/AcrR family transcriptional regulator [Heteroscytonema crispum UTEX LB 1556]